MYAFYDSLKLDSSWQFDLFPINFKESQNKQRCEDKMASHMEAYFIDHRLRQATKTQSEGRPISIDLSSISTEKSKEALGAKRKKLRNEYYKIYRKNCRQNLAFKEKERKSKQFARRNPDFKAKETVYQKESKQSARRDPAFKTKENKSKQSERRNPFFKAKETVYQKESKQSARRDPAFKTKENKSKQSERRNPVFKAKETVYQKESKQSAQRDPAFKTKENKSK